MLYQTYASLLPKNLQKLDPRFFARALFKAIGLNETDFRFGLTRVFFKPGKFKEFDMIMRSDPAELAKMIKAVEKWIVRSYWRRVGYCVLSSIKCASDLHFVKLKFWASIHCFALCWFQ